MGYVTSVFATTLLTALLTPIREHINSTTVALGFLLVVLFVAIGWGSKPALVAAILGVVCLNFFFLPPFHTFTVADAQNWIALIVFFITALTVGQLSAIARRRATEAEHQKRKSERCIRIYKALSIELVKPKLSNAVNNSNQPCLMLLLMTFELRLRLLRLLLLCF